MLIRILYSLFAGLLAASFVLTGTRALSRPSHWRADRPQATPTQMPGW